MPVKRYTADELHGNMYYTLPDDAEFVAASDYDALLARDNIRTFAEQEARIAELERERDELKRRLTKITYKLGNSTIPAEDSGWRKWYQKMYATIIAIAEGRDNG